MNVKFPAALVCRDLKRSLASTRGSSRHNKVMMGVVREPRRGWSTWNNWYRSFPSHGRLPQVTTRHPAFAQHSVTKIGKPMILLSMERLTGLQCYWKTSKSFEPPSEKMMTCTVATQNTEPTRATGSACYLVQRGLFHSSKCFPTSYLQGKRQTGE